MSENRSPKEQAALDVETALAIRSTLGYALTIIRILEEHGWHYRPAERRRSNDEQ